MNLSRIFEMQKDLDKAISSRNDIDTSNRKISKADFNDMQLLATLVETAEFANEVQTFKYWKANKTVNPEKALEEFADILHFLGSFAYKYDVDPNIEPLIMSENVNRQICLLFSTISSAINNLNKYVIGQMLALLLGAAKLLNYSEEEIIKWYDIKNKKNYERIKDKY
ncbi:dUTP diphosphatase [Mycoplasma tauri]|uniref:dUTP diphosphatase n=1 Tax=Mycoplasma tauri TaxID=547987 RepID=A0A953NEU6_9MOLU|nr:dUTP diphosphatase [Mycoplasma tauri]MBZ4195663.1 dUTP diphosphatase [Mycoplasma tauri]MBZ4203822.1 dUTP diphosphatase [Mycoplasma tauri]MBZ4204440.1 dUTP diphosphatase [Mycoplasma tauri]MBZ4212437.1 dUTP diphosphatase [Mycoplasma tauri]MBZ4218135.1 dUTP diphosphatase [Mycoplasma tauri]